MTANTMAFPTTRTRRGAAPRGTVRMALRHATLAMLAAGALAALAPDGARAQSAIPVSPVEQRAIEARLSTILDYARANELSQFRLGSGANVQVRAYQTVDRATARPCQTCRSPCRGYRVDYTSPAAGSIAIEGFRCRRANGVWTAVQPETVIARSPGFTAPDTEVASTPTPPERVPLPRPSPRRTAAVDVGHDGGGQETGTGIESPAIAAARAALQRNGGATDAAATAAVPEPRVAPTEPSPVPGTGGQDREPAPATAADTGEAPPPPGDVGADGGTGGPEVLASGGDVPDAPDDVARQTDTDTSSGPLVARAPTSEEVRTVLPDDRTPRVITLDPADSGHDGVDDGTTARPGVAGLRDEEIDILAQDLDIIEALEDLFYLEPGSDIPAVEEVAVALSQFVDDEQLPGDTSVAELTVRLQEARARNGVVSACDGSGSATMCFED